MYVREMCLCVDVGTCVEVREHPGCLSAFSTLGGLRTPSFSLLLFKAVSFRLFCLVSADSPVHASYLPLGVARVTDNCATLPGF